MLTVLALLDRNVAQTGHRPAILDAAGDLSWTQFRERVAVTAGALAGLGVKRGETFGVLMRNSARCFELLHAGYWLGAIPVPINFRLAPAEIAQIIGDARCLHVMVETAFESILEHPASVSWKAFATVFGDSCGPEATRYESMLADAAPLEAADPDADAEALLLFTGGTTGRSKGVRLSHTNILSNNLAFGLAVGARPEHVYLHAAPMFHSADLLALGWMLQGAAQCYLPAFTPSAFLEAIRRYSVGAVVTVPTMLIGTVASPGFAAADVSSLRVLIYGAAPMSLEWIARVAEAFPHVELFNCYGLTETSPDLTIFGARDFRAAIDHMVATGERGGRLLSVGKPNALNELRVLGPDGREVGVGEAGELVARGPNIMMGYDERPEETGVALRNGWLHTGDLARIDQDGYVYLLDRLKDMVITGGENVYCSEVEAVLHRHPAVAEAAIVGAPDERLGELVVAVVVAKPGATPSTEEIAAHCRASLGGFKVPRRIVFVDQLPKSALGKVLKGDLRKAHAEAAT